MTREKPRCPLCSKNDFVRTLGGGSLNKYRYHCENPSCKDMKWQQIPPYLLSTDDQESERKICKRRSTSSKGYKCSKCGQPKKGHICSKNNTDEETDLITTGKQLQSLNSSYTPPSSSFSEPFQAESISMHDDEGIDLTPFSNYHGLPA